MAAIAPTVDRLPLAGDALRGCVCLATNQPPKSRPSSGWAYLGDAANPYTLFDLTPGRGQTYPEAFLAGYRGFVHADAYDGYNVVHDNVRHLGCLMHARRYFIEAETTDPRAGEGLAFIRTLYAVEKELQVERGRLGDRFPADDAVRWRRTRAGPILARFAARIRPAGAAGGGSRASPLSVPADGSRGR